MPLDLADALAPRLLAALALGMLVGLERQWRDKEAGLRTNALVALGSAAFAAFGLLAVPGDAEASPTRVAAGVVSGVGFLGAGAILRDGPSGGVRGLTTAATLWCSAAVGLFCGAGAYAAAAALATSVVGANLAFRPVVRAMDAQRRRGGGARKARGREDEEAGAGRRAYRLSLSCASGEATRLRAILARALDEEAAAVAGDGGGLRLRGLATEADGPGRHARAVVTADLDAEGVATATRVEALAERLAGDPAALRVAWSDETPTADDARRNGGGGGGVAAATPGD